MGLIDYLTAKDERLYKSSLEQAFYACKSAGVSPPLNHTFYTSNSSMSALEIGARLILPALTLGGAALTRDSTAIYVALAINAIYSTRHIGRYLINTTHTKHIAQSLQEGRHGILTEDQEKKISKLRKWF